MVNSKRLLPFSQNRELSWLKFNERVLNEAMDESVPLLERLKFLAIFTSNLDEFFMVRVGSLYDLDFVSPEDIDKKSGLTPSEQIQAIYAAVRPLYAKKELYYNKLSEQLARHHIRHLTWDKLSEKQAKEAQQYFQQSVLPILSPLIINSHHPFPHMENKKIYSIAMMQLKSKKVLGIVPIPANLPEIYYFDSVGLQYIYTADIVLHFIETIFTNYTILEKHNIRVTRNADINLDADIADFNIDFRSKMKKALKKRKRLTPVRLEVTSEMSPELSEYLYEKLTLHADATYLVNAPTSLGNAFDIGRKLPHQQRKILEYPPLTPRMPTSIDMANSILKQIRSRDILLCYPFESFQPFLKFLKESAHDPDVISIKITIYRLSSKSKLVEYLCAAAENGKDVTILIELRARFDEQNNIDWSERLEEAGCNIIYGFDDYKVHSKICLVTKREKNEIRYYTQIGTGNYNEKTSTQYTDLSLMTYNQEIGRDANTFFQNLGIANLNGNYSHLLVAPNSMKSQLLHMIEAEGNKGKDGQIFIKANSLTDYDTILALQHASANGAKIDLIIRGICCLIPQVKGYTENIHVSNIVGRFLEHSRIYAFGKGEDMSLYISSADCMTRNLTRRVEIACPIYDPAVKAQILKIVELCQNDNVKARTLLSNGEYTNKPQNQEPLDSQKTMLETPFETYIEELSKPQSCENSSNKVSGFFKKIVRIFKAPS